MRGSRRQPSAGEGCDHGLEGGPGVAGGDSIFGLEMLETRLVLSAPSIQLNLELLGGGSPSLVGYIPIQIQTAYGLSKGTSVDDYNDNISFGGIHGNGEGQTIAIVVAYDNPGFVSTGSADWSTSDLAQFDKAFSLPDPPSFTKYNQSGETTGLPGSDVKGGWGLEEALDIESAHAIAPLANIIVVEASGGDRGSLFNAAETARNKFPGVSVVSMSFGNDVSSLGFDDRSEDAIFTTPVGHEGITFLAGSGDKGSPGIYPAASPNVVAVGGTTLTVSGTVGSYSYGGETGWLASGGGTIKFEPEPPYQEGVQSTGFRTSPDVSFDADPATGVAIHDSYDLGSSTPWGVIGGTSLATPCWAGLIAIADQGRVARGATTLDGPSQTLPALYSLPASDFHDIVTGSNGGFSAGPGYDEVTGLGTPKADLLVPDIVKYEPPSVTADRLVVTAEPPSSVIAGDRFGIIVAAEDASGLIDTSFNGSLTVKLANNPGGAVLGGSVTVTASQGVAVIDPIPADSGLTLDKVGQGYTLSIVTAGLMAVTTSPIDVTTDPTPGAGTYYPVPTDSSLRHAISQAEGQSNSYAKNTIILTASAYPLTDTSTGTS